MFTKNAPSFLLDSELARHQLLLILCRLVVVLFITLTAWRFESDIQFSLSSLGTSPAPLVLVTFVLSGGYLIWLRFGYVLTRQIRVQLLIDVLLVTWLVWQTGVFISPYGALYVIIISVAGMYLGRPDAIRIAGACTLCFTALTLVSTEPVVYSITGAIEPSSTARTIAFNDVAFLVVGLLAARIADRRQIGEELKNIEANFANLRVLHERILFSVNSGLVTTDLHGKIFAFNRAAEEITGRRAAEVLGKHVGSVFGASVADEVGWCGIDTRKSADLLPPSFESELVVGADKRLTLTMTVLPLTSAKGNVTGVLIVFQDSTQMSAMAERLKQADRMAAVGRVAAGLAHEIRNPMGAMSSALQYVSEKPGVDRESAELMGVAIRESNRLNTIITNFLAYAQPNPLESTAGESDEVDVSRAISDCLALLRHDPAVTDEHLFSFTPPAKPVKMRADEARFKQIVWNLLRNSIAAMPTGGELSIDVLEPRADRVRVVVSDTGCGIAPEQMARIFEPFHSGSNGTGLGLSIVHRLVTEGGGRIDVASTPDTGTRFFVDLPRSN